MIELSPLLVYLTLVIIGAFCAAIYLLVIGSNEYTVEDMQRSAEASGNEKDSRGRITRFLLVSYAIMVAWALAYLYMHINEFIAFP